MALLWIIWLLSALVTTPISINAKEVYVRSSDNETCPAQPCFTLSEYVIEMNHYFTDNTSFMFLSGDHHLHTPLHIMNVSDARFQAFSGLQNDSESVQVFLGPLVNVSWSDCEGIEISGLIFILNGNTASGLSFSALAFQRTFVSLSGLTLIRNGTLELTAIKAESDLVI